MNDKEDYTLDGILYNSKSGSSFHEIEEDEIKIHCGMPAHILTAGEIPAAAHAIFIPQKEGLVRMSQAVFFGLP